MLARNSTKYISASLSSRNIIPAIQKRHSADNFAAAIFIGAGAAVVGAGIATGLAVGFPLGFAAGYYSKGLFNKKADTPPSPSVTETSQADISSNNRKL